MKQIIDEKVPFNIDRVDVVGVQIPRGHKCIQCRRIFSSEQSHFYCYFTQEHLCYECGTFEDKKEKRFGKRFRYFHNLVYIDETTPPELLAYVDDYKFGKDLQPEPHENYYNQDYYCHSCMNWLSGRNRWVCLSCKSRFISGGEYYHNVCQVCFEGLQATRKLDKNSEQYEAFFKKYNQKGHDMTHLLHRVLMNVQLNYEY